MRQSHICLLMVLGLIVPSFGETKGLEALMAQRPDWPKQVTMVQSVTANLFTKEGKHMGRQPLAKGRTLEMYGVFREGVALKIGKMVVFVPPGDTDLEEGIKNVQRKKDLILAKPRPDRISSGRP